MDGWVWATSQSIDCAGRGRGPTPSLWAEGGPENPSEPKVFSSLKKRLIVWPELEIGSRAIGIFFTPETENKLQLNFLCWKK